MRRQIAKMDLCSTRPVCGPVTHFKSMHNKSITTVREDIYYTTPTPPCRDGFIEMIPICDPGAHFRCTRNKSITTVREDIYYTTTTPPCRDGFIEMIPICASVAYFEARPKRHTLRGGDIIMVMLDYTTRAEDGSLGLVDARQAHNGFAPCTAAPAA